MSEDVLGMRACEDCGALTQMNAKHMTDPRPFYAMCNSCLTKYVEAVKMKQSQTEGNK